MPASSLHVWIVNIVLGGHIRPLGTRKERLTDATALDKPWGGWGRWGKDQIAMKLYVSMNKVPQNTEELKGFTPMLRLELWHLLIRLIRR